MHGAVQRRAAFAAKVRPIAEPFAAVNRSPSILQTGNTERRRRSHSDDARILRFSQDVSTPMFGLPAGHRCRSLSLGWHWASNLWLARRPFTASFRGRHSPRSGTSDGRQQGEAAPLVNVG
jgi:hypothetical protein